MILGQIPWGDVTVGVAWAIIIGGILYTAMRYLLPIYIESHDTVVSSLLDDNRALRESHAKDREVFISQADAQRKHDHEQMMLMIQHSKASEASVWRHMQQFVDAEMKQLDRLDALIGELKREREL